MYRKYINDLINWLNNDNRKPLIVWGARQVGKSYLIKDIFAEEYFNGKYIYVDCRTDHDGSLTVSLLTSKKIQHNFIGILTSYTLYMIFLLFFSFDHIMLYFVVFCVILFLGGLFYAFKYFKI